MNELIEIIKQRKQSIRLIHLNHPLALKSLYVEQQRKRHERENWILRVLKNIKIHTLEQKRLIYETTLLMMRTYQPVSDKQPDFEQANYTEIMINLFVQFYNAMGDVDTTHIRTIIRPNNSYIIVDLVKTLLELSREEFRQVVHERFKEIQRTRSARKPSVPRVGQEPTIIIVKKPTEVSERLQSPVKTQQRSQLSTQTKIELALFERYSRTVQNFHYQRLFERINEVYVQLAQANGKNCAIIQRYLDVCFGARRHINYDASGLYTQQEIAQIIREKKQTVQSRMAEVQDLRGECSPEQFKQFFKMKVEVYESANSLPVFQRPPAVRRWLPLVVVKNGDKSRPLGLLVSCNGNLYEMGEFEQRYDKRVRAYIRESLLEKHTHLTPKLAQDPSYLGFNRKEYLDYSCSKFIDQMQREFLVCSAKRKNREGLFPAIVQPEEQLRKGKKSKSESSLFGGHLEIPPLLPRQVDRKLNCTSLVVGHQNASRARVSLIIDKFLNTKQYSVN